ncbi:ATP-binding protein [Ferrimonas aestuarii]|uniref:histidine kinase n=1 Tax=Ferrimonas aestuarii TaxID=2569539 RepID=A0A4U1BSJ4_9GAMM|nr:ATP-binding protein [Ferrimonas aestuarii]TKB56500.1 sensor histidine kinase [Ferrimonas aestuarii]
MRSIRTNLILWLTALVLITSSLGFANSLFTAKNYYHQLAMGSLAQRARTMLQLLNESDSSDIQRVVSLTAKRFDQLDLVVRAPWGAVERNTVHNDQRVQYQIWKDDHCLSVNGVPCDSVPVFTNIDAGFAEQQVNGELWTTYTLYSVQHQMFLTVGYPHALGRGMMENAMWASWGTQMLLITPFTLFICSIIVGFNLRPLRRLSKHLKNTPNKALPDVTTMPEELQSTVMALQNNRTELMETQQERYQILSQLSDKMRSRLQRCQDQVHRASMSTTKLHSQLAQLEMMVTNGRMLNELNRPETIAGISNLYRQAAMSCARFYQYGLARDVRLTLRGNAHLGDVALPEVMVQSVLDNLVDNAIKVSPRGSEVIISVRDGHDGRLVVTVADGGPGFDEGFSLERISENFDGRLGLLVVNRVLQRYCGEISLGESRLLGGAHVRCLMPLASQPSAVSES